MTIVDAGVRKQLDLQVVVPVEDMSELGKPVLQDESVDPEVRTSIWPHVYPELLKLIRAHTSTLIFVNSRRLAERLPTSSMSSLLVKRASKRARCPNWFALIMARLQESKDLRSKMR